MDFSSLFLNRKSIFGSDKAWKACSDDVATFNKYRLNIDSYLAHSGIPECSEHLWIALYRIGKSEDDAKTVVVVSCTNHKIRKLTKESLRSCPLFQEGGGLAQFKIIGKATPPNTGREPVPTMQCDNEPNRLSNNSSGELILYTQPSGHASRDHQPGVFLSRDRSAIGNDYLGSRILARQQSKQGASTSQSATAGPLILVDGQSYQLTVHHVVNFDCPNGQEFRHVADDWDDEDIEELEGSCGSDEVLAAWNAPMSLSGSRESPYRGLSEAMFSDSSSASSSNGKTKLKAFEDPEPHSQPLYRGSTTSAPGPSGPETNPEATVLESLSSLQPSALDEHSPLYGSAEIDYLLIPVEIESGRMSGSAEIVQVCGHFSAYELTEARPVIIATTFLGHVRGAMFPAPMFSRRPRSQNFQTLFCVQSEKTIPKGASGSAIFDEETGLLAGYIVLGCPTEDIWYMTPISTVLDDLRERLGAQVSCQIQLDTRSLSHDSHNPEEPTDRSTSYSAHHETCEGTNGKHLTNRNIPSQHHLPADGKRSSPYIGSQGQISSRSPSSNGPRTPARHTLGCSIRRRIFEPADMTLQSFLPRDKLEEVLTEERIIETLGTEGGFPLARQKAILEEVIRPQCFDPEIQPHLCSRKEIFAILSLINKVSTIESFIEEDLFDFDLPFRYIGGSVSRNDDRHPRAMKTSGLKGGPKEIPLFYRWTEQEAESFEFQQWKIHVPVFDGIPKTNGAPPHYTLDQKAIVPRMSRVEVGRGGFSAVDKVEIHAAHDIHSDNPVRNAVVAIKRLDNGNRRVFDREVSAYNSFAKQDVPHLTQLLWTFSLGTTYHLVFPCADGSLYDLFDSKQFECPLAEKNNHDAALWFARQCLGIVEGLNTIHQGDSDNDSLGPLMYCRHGDLKPENILLFRNSGTNEAGYSLGTLKISDFGMARFHTTQTESYVDLDRIGCSLTYRAPEYDTLRKIGQSYDIWCLGCVLLEFTTWYLKGEGAVDNFARNRLDESTTPRIREDTFFNQIQNGNTVGAIAKRCVGMEFQNLYHHENTSDFIIDFAELLETSLLRIHPDHRMKCPDIVAQLQKLFDRSLRNPDYCLGLRRKPPTRRNTDLSLLDPEELPGRESFASIPWLAPFRNSKPIADSLLEESDAGLDIRVQRNTVGFQPQQPFRPMTNLDSNIHRKSLPYIPKRPVNLLEAERDEAGRFILPNLGGHSGRLSGIYYNRLTRNSCVGNRIF